MPTYRPAVRYLVALNLMTDREDEAARYEAKMRALEPEVRCGGAQWVREIVESDCPYVHSTRI